jgi:hypothetical protein
VYVLHHPSGRFASKGAVIVGQTVEVVRRPYKD